MSAGAAVVPLRPERMTAGEAVYQAIRVYGPFGSTDGALPILMGVLDDIRRNCPDENHRPPEMDEEQVGRIVAALSAAGCISTEKNMLRNAAKQDWTMTGVEVTAQRVEVARGIQ